jgi:hypothetical protein
MHHTNAVNINATNPLFFRRTERRLESGRRRFLIFCHLFFDLLIVPFMMNARRFFPFFCDKEGNSSLQQQREIDDNNNNNNIIIA